MAGRDEKFSANPKTAIFNRSLTLTVSKKPYLCNSLERSGSIKKLHNSPFESVGNSIKGKVKRLCSVFENSKSPTSVLITESNQPQQKSNLQSEKLWGSDSIRIPGTEDRVVVYLTSLRGIRRTFEDCYAVRLILRGFRVRVDERDISMDSDYRKELQNLLGEKTVTLPQVFIRGRYIGGADVIKNLHEVGDLAKMLKGLPIRAPGYVCDGCGDVRFIPCWNCNGSKKIYDEDEDQRKRCLECNENGLIRCPACCS